MPDPSWSDLSDDELVIRLSRRVQGWRARDLTEKRDDEAAAQVIDSLLGYD